MLCTGDYLGRVLVGSSIGGEGLSEKTSGTLSQYRILDLTNERGLLCGKILGDLGADVIKVEKPEGDPARSIGPFYHDILEPENSLYWWAFNTSKRGITLDIETTDGQEIFKRLVKTADVIIESFDPGYMDKLGLGYNALSQINPKLVMASITGFGQTGPYQEYKSPDIVLWALSGHAQVTGDPDRAPLMPMFPISYFFGVMGATIGITVALYHRSITGEGQFVDASSLLGLAWAIGPEVHGLWDSDKEIVKRAGRMWQRAQIDADTGTRFLNLPLIYPCKDGAIRYFPFVQPGMLPSVRALTQWVIDDGMASETLKNVDWSKVDWQTMDQETADEITGSFSRFFMNYTKAELWEEAQKKGIQLYPLLTPKDMLEFKQLAAREYWTEVEHPELGTTFTYPGAFTKMTEAPCKVERRAPLFGEHNQEIYENELGLSPEELLLLKQAKVI
jgi:crotonobetainyl-CoA:carnitine CoA-transferase CaiB-like acyl-CoA transferase